eukprot:jgi/Mesvir1/11700/Mv25444-RA.1
MLWPGIRCGDGLVEGPVSSISRSRRRFLVVRWLRRGWRGRLQADFFRALGVICDPSVTGIPDALLDLAFRRDAVRLVAGDCSPLCLGPSPLLATLLYGHRHLMTEHETIFWLEAFYTLRGGSLGALEAVSVRVVFPFWRVSAHVDACDRPPRRGWPIEFRDSCRDRWTESCRGGLLLEGS